MTHQKKLSLIVRSEMSESELDSCKKKPTCKNTERAKLWAVRVFNDCINNLPGSEAEKYS